MERVALLIDICIVCALPEEVTAFLQVVQPHCQSPLQEGISSRYGYSYRTTTLTNEKDELLRVHISWLPRYGPQEMTLHLSHVLEECHPRIALMTGICAGDAQQHVQLGDVVVAERTFTYDTGKVTLDDDGRPLHLHDTLTYQLDATMLQFLGLFTAWKRRVSRLKRPSLPAGMTLTRRDVVCHIKPMASGSALREDHPFEDVRVPVRGTVAIDMEGAAFGLVASRHPLIRWLVVKGVCDYADKEKSDIYHDYAARASALYALSFIRAYVTTERLPRLPGPSSQAGPSPIWNVPHARNPYFTGRSAILRSLRQSLVPGAKATALTQAISGLGGVGKTQIAVEYAHQYAERYEAVLWLQADSRDTLTTACLTLATQVLGLPEHQEAQRQVEAVTRWLQTHRRWLLILDNVEEPEQILSAFLPSRHEGSVLITTRRRDVGPLARAEILAVLSEEEGVLLLVRRAGRIAPQAPVSEASAEDVVHATALCALMDGLPLALDQAGAYIAANGSSLERYRDLYQRSRHTLLDRRNASDHPDSVLVTVRLSWDAIEQRNPLAGKALACCAFLAPEQIPERVVQAGLTMAQEQTAPDALQMDEALGLLHRYSLVERREEMLSVHRLVQEVIQEVLSEEECQQWMERAAMVVNAVFPDGAYGTWPLCEVLLPHALVCVKWITILRQKTPGEARLLDVTGRYLYERAQYSEAELLYQQVLAIREEQLGPAHPDTATSLNNLAALYESQGRYGEAEPLMKRALAISEEQLGPAHPDTATSLDNLAALYKSQGRYGEAEPLYQQALAIREEQLGPAHPQTAASLNNLAELYQAQGKYEEAEPLYQQALAISEEQLGPAHPDTATSLDNLAALYKSQGRYGEAEPLYQQALAISEEQLGATHPNTAQSLNNLAALYESQGRYPESEPLLQRALAISEEQLGPAHPQTAASLNNLAALYKSQGRYGEAEPLMKRALAISEEQLGPAHPQTAASLNNLVTLYESQGRYPEAEPLYQRALAIREEQLGATHPDTATSLNNLALLYQGQGRYGEAEPLYQRALAIREEQLGATHPNTAQSLNNLAALYRSQGKYEQAEPLSQRAVEVVVASLRMEHPHTQQILMNHLRLLSDIYTDGDLDALLQLLAQQERSTDMDVDTTGDQEPE